MALNYKTTEGNDAISMPPASTAGDAHTYDIVPTLQ